LYNTRAAVVLFVYKKTGIDFLSIPESVYPYLKGESALMMFDHHANLKYKFGNRHFWVEGCYVSTVGLNEFTIKKCIRDQEKHDMVVNKLTTVEYSDPF